MGIESRSARWYTAHRHRPETGAGGTCLVWGTLMGIKRLLPFI